MIIAPGLWIPTAPFTPLPVLELPGLPGSVSTAVYGLLLLGLAASLLLDHRKLLLVWCALLFARGAFDRALWQPYFFQYAFILLALGLRAKPSRAEDGRTVDPLNIGRVVLVATYFWSGVSKIDHTFVSAGLGAVFAPIGDWFPVAALVKAGWLVPIGELALAPLLLIRRTRLVGIAGAIAMHVLILLAIGPLAGGLQVIVWPWNVTMIALVLILFARTSSLRAREVLLPVDRLHRAVVLLFLVAPILGYVGNWDPYLSFKVYSYRTHAAYVRVSAGVRAALPPRAREGLRAPVKPGELTPAVNVGEWGHKTFGAYLPPARGNYIRVGRALCRYSDKPSDVLLTLIEPPSPFPDALGNPIYGARANLDCEKLRR